MSNTTDTPKYMNRGGEVWERTDAGEREIFAADVVKRLTDLECQLAKAREVIASLSKAADKLEEDKESNARLCEQWEIEHAACLKTAADAVAVADLAIDQRDTLAEACKALLESEGVQRAWPLDGTKRAEKPSDAFSSATATVKFRRLLAIHEALASIKRKEVKP